MDYRYYIQIVISLSKKRDDLCMLICECEPDVILLTETIPKAQVLSISPALLEMPGYTLYCNFQPESPNLGRSGKRGDMHICEPQVTCS